MKRIVALILMTLSGTAAFAQTSAEEQYEGTALVDTTLAGNGIFDIMPSNVSLHFSDALMSAFESYRAGNVRKQQVGFRIRLFSRNGQNARALSGAALARCLERYPSLAVDRRFDNPNFVVEAGYFRTRLEAESILETMKNEFPDATIVREKFRFASLR